MDHSLRVAVIALGLATALIHLSLVPTYGPLFVVNGAGYLTLVALYAAGPARIRRRVTFAFLGYAALTMLAWVAIGERSAITYADKAIEVALLLALWRSLARAREERTTTA